MNTMYPSSAPFLLHKLQSIIHNTSCKQKCNSIHMIFYGMMLKATAILQNLESGRFIKIFMFYFLKTRKMVASPPFLLELTASDQRSLLNEFRLSELTIGSSEWVGYLQTRIVCDPL